MQLCGCRAVGSLCDRCVEDDVGHLAGTAFTRGYEWARKMREELPEDLQRQPWPQTDKMLRAARLQVRELTKDERVLDALAKSAAKGAARRWDVGPYVSFCATAATTGR